MRISHSVAAFALVGGALLAGTNTASANARPAPVQTMLARPKCDFTLHFRHNPTWSVTVNGTCSGHAVTDDMVRHAIVVLFGRTPADRKLHVYKHGKHAWVVCGGNCDTSARITDKGKAFIS